jgi:hypothetical protein
MYSTPSGIAALLYAQRVTISWTKRSRGVSGANVRARCPHVFALTDVGLKQLASNNTYSSVLMREPNFTPEISIEPHFTFLDAHDWGAVAVKFPHNNSAIVRYTYSTFDVGAPDRSPRPPISCPLGLDELVRVEYNGRTARKGDEWRYTHTIFTFVLTEHPTATMFLAEPARRLVDLADLW